MKRTLSRRRFLTATAATTAAASAAAVVGFTGAMPAKAAPKGPFVCVFSKHLQFLDYEELAKTCKKLDLDGIDLTVRKGGHVEPENVASDLPRAVDAIRSQDLDVHMITTRLTNGSDPEARPILEAASELGIRHFRIGGLKYERQGDPMAALPKFAEGLRSLVEVAQEYDMVAGYHNHSGFQYVAAPLWDLYWMIREIGWDGFGSNFDVGHATVEGGYGGWQINARLMAPYVKMMAVKDFVWENGRPKWVPLGQGHVQTAEFLKIMNGVGFEGPISMHFEYKVPSDNAMLDEVGKAAVTFREALKQAGYG